MTFSGNRWLLLSFFFLSPIALMSADPCPDISHYYHRKFGCMPCPGCIKGYGLNLNKKIERSDLGMATCYSCEKCPNGTYQNENIFVGSCTPCDKCERRETALSCTNISNSICGACWRGYQISYKNGTGICEKIEASGTGRSTEETVYLSLFCVSFMALILTVVGYFIWRFWRKRKAEPNKNQGATGDETVANIDQEPNTGDDTNICSSILWFCWRKRKAEPNKNQVPLLHGQNGTSQSATGEESVANRDQEPNTGDDTNMPLLDRRNGTSQGATGEGSVANSDQEPSTGDNTNMPLLHVQNGTSQGATGEESVANRDQEPNTGDDTNSATGEETVVKIVQEPNTGDDTNMPLLHVQNGTSQGATGEESVANRDQEPNTGDDTNSATGEETVVKIVQEPNTGDDTNSATGEETVVKIVQEPNTGDDTNSATGEETVVKIVQEPNTGDDTNRPGGSTEGNEDFDVMDDREISRNVTDWKRFARLLNLTETDIIDIEQAEKGLWNLVYCTLKTFRKRFPNDKKSIKKALISMQECRNSAR